VASRRDEEKFIMVVASRYEEKFIKEYRIQVDDYYSDDELSRIFNENETELRQFFNIKKNFLELREFSISEERIVKRELECMANPWINEFEYDKLETFGELREFAKVRKLGDKIKKGEKYYYYFGHQRCGGYGEYTANIQANNYALSQNMFDYC
jgi:hypothetical protein